jgi:hypothetical protein
MFLLFAATSFDWVNAAEVAQWLVVLLPATLFCGMLGIMEALCGRRKRALWGGAFAGIPGLLFGGSLLLTVLNGGTHRLSFAVFCAGGLPLFVAFWAVLLAYLVPEKPQQPDEP